MQLMRASVGKWCCGVLLLIALGGNSSGVGRKSSPHKPTQRYATQVGNTIQLHPAEVTFQLPEAWTEPNALLRPTPRELHKVGVHLWGATIADAALKLRDCAVQVTPDNLMWIRAYIVDAPEEEILRRIREKGRAAAQEIPNYAPKHISRGFQTEAAQEGPWQHIDVPYGVNFGDYNSGGSVSFYLRPASGRELVMVVSYFGTGFRSTAETQDVLKSVVMPGAP
jgi:hypothetical protein